MVTRMTMRYKENRFRMIDLPFLVYAYLSHRVRGGHISNYLIKPVVVRSSDGYDWLWSPGMHPLYDLSITWSKGYESFLQPYFHLGKDDVFIDVGAHHGRYSVRMAKRCWKVLAFEPNPLNVRILRTNLELNKVSNVLVLPYACWNERAILHLSLEGGSSHLGTAGVIVQALPLDSFSGNVQRVDLVKIDAEGAEYQVLLGMHGIMMRYKPRLIVELHPWSTRERDLLHLLEEQEYQYKRISSQPNNYVVASKLEK